MKSNFFKTIALTVCLLTLFWCFYTPAYSWGWGNIWKCLAALATLAAAVSAVISICGSAIASIVLTGGSISSIVLSVACLASIAAWVEASKEVDRRC